MILLIFIKKFNFFKKYIICKINFFKLFENFVKLLNN